MAGEVVQQVELAGVSSSSRPSRVTVRPDGSMTSPADLDGGVLGVLLLRHPSKNGTHPGVQRRRREGLGDEVVGAGFERSHQGGLVVARRHHDHRHGRHRPQHAQQLDAVDVREPEVEDHEVDLGGNGLLQPGHARRGGGDDVAPIGEGVQQRPPDLGVVLDDEQVGHTAETSVRAPTTGIPPFAGSRLRADLGLRASWIRPVVPQNAGMRRWPLLLGWFVAAVVATSVGFAAVALVDGGLQPADAVSDSPLVGDAGSAQPQGVTASPSGSLLAPAPEVSSSTANGGASGPAAPAPGASASTRNGTSGAGGATSGSSGQAPASAEPNSSRPRSGGSVASPAPTRSGSAGVTRSISTSGGFGHRSLLVRPRHADGLVTDAGLPRLVGAPRTCELGTGRVRRQHEERVHQGRVRGRRAAFRGREGGSRRVGRRRLIRVIDQSDPLGSARAGRTGCAARPPTPGRRRRRGERRRARAGR